jgi:hypothetical protein
MLVPQRVQDAAYTAGRSLVRPVCVAGGGESWLQQRLENLENGCLANLVHDGWEADATLLSIVLWDRYGEIWKRAIGPVLQLLGQQSQPSTLCPGRFDDVNLVHSSRFSLAFDSLPSRCQRGEGGALLIQTAHCSNSIA